MPWRRFEWHRLRPLQTAMQQEGEASTDAAAVINDLRSALERDELVTSISKALKAAEDGVFDWLTQHLPPMPIDPPRSTLTSTDKCVDAPPGLGTSRLWPSLQAFLEQHPEDDVEVTWRVIP